MGGTADGNQTGLIRIDLTDIWDAHSLVAYFQRLPMTAGTSIPDLHRTGHDHQPQGQASLRRDAFDGTSYLNFIRNPQDPFEADATLDVFNYAIHQQRRRGRVDPVRLGRDRLPPRSSR